jgi:SWIM zinc finger
VAIPRRWIRALGEVQALQADMSPAMSVSGREAWRFLRSLPRRRGGRAAYRVVESGNDGLRLAHGSTSGVPLAGTERLRALEPLAAEATRLVVYVHSSGATGWSLEFADSRLLLVVSPTPSRGLSGEGALLSNLVYGSAAADATLLAALCWRPQVPLHELADQLGLDKGVVRGRLARLAASGLVGFDLTDGAYFFRSLPIGQQASVDQPRLARARELVDLGRVLISPANGRHTATVTGRDGDYLVAIDRQMSCTCGWFASNAAGRGPCSHILAVQLTLSR